MQTARVRGGIKNMKSALFVDFDNVFSQLRQLQPDAAERFARHPSEWIGWMTSSLPLPEPHEEGERRRLLVRRGCQRSNGPGVFFFARTDLPALRRFSP
jgi:hypothetical protein